MLSPFIKSKTTDLVIMVVLAIFVAFLWLDLRVIREELGAMQGERDLLTLKVNELKLGTHGPFQAKRQ